MLLILVACLLVGLASAVPQGAASRYENIDVDTILNNQRLLGKYVDCLLDKGPCTADGRFLKETLPEALRTRCAKCSDKQKSTARKVITSLRKGHPKELDALLKKFDPQETHKKWLEEELKA